MADRPDQQAKAPPDPSWSRSEERPAPGGASEAAAGRLPRFSSDTLFGASSRVVIEHGGQEYVLLITRKGRLLLNRRS